MSKQRERDDVATWPAYQHRFTATQPCPTLGYGPQATITVHAELHYLKGNARPYFAVGAEIWARPKARDCDAGGCLHDEVLQYWPQLAPVVALHLSTDAGEPMYAEGNGWYWLAGYYGGAGERYHGGNSQGHYGGQYRCPTPEECLQIFADYVRVSGEDARALAEGWRADDDPPSMRRWFGQWVTQQADRWRAEADAAIALLDRLIAEQAAAGVSA